MENTWKRQANIELLRVVAMLMIIGSHLALHGIQADMGAWSAGNRINRIFTSMLKPGGVGVAVFFIITGWFNGNKEKISVKRTTLTTAFYGFVCGLIGILGLVKGLNPVSADSAKNLMRCFLSPVMGGGWWFVTAYILLALIAPTINRYVAKMNNREAALLVAGFWFFEYTVGNIISNQYFPIQRAIMFYLIGTCLKKYNKYPNKRGLFLLGSGMAYCLHGMIQYVSDSVIARGKSGILDEIIIIVTSCLSNSVLIIVEAVLLFLFFLQITIDSRRILEVGKSVFGVYLLHDSIFTRNLIWHNVVKTEKIYEMRAYPVITILVIGGVFLSCYIVERIRIKFFEDIMEGTANRCVQFIRCFGNKIL